MRKVISIPLLFLAACSGGDDPSRPERTSGQLLVYTVNYPLAYMAERIGGEQIRVEFPAPADGDPAFWKPGPEVIARYQEADLILLNGAGYARWIEKASLPLSALVNTSKAFRDRYVKLEGKTTHVHGPGGKHEHGNVAFTTWLDFRLAGEQAKAVAEALSLRMPEHAETFRRNLALLLEELSALDRDVRNLVQGPEKTPLLASHPVYQYLRAGYGLNLRSVHWEPDEVPDAKEWENLRSLLKEHPSAWLLWEAEPRPETARRLKTLGVGCLVYDPCGNAPESGDFLSVLRANIENLKEAFGER